jgi:hypothetical protein
MSALATAVEVRLPIALDAFWATAAPVSLNRLVVLLRKAPRLEAVCVCAAPGVVLAVLPLEEDDEEVLEASFPNRLVEVEAALLLELELEVELEVELEELPELDVVAGLVEELMFPAKELCRPRPLRLPARRGAMSAAKRSA